MLVRIHVSVILHLRLHFFPQSTHIMRFHPNCPRTRHFTHEKSFPTKEIILESTSHVGNTIFHSAGKGNQVPSSYNQLFSCIQVLFQHSPSGIQKDIPRPIQALQDESLSTKESSAKALSKLDGNVDQATGQKTASLTDNLSLIVVQIHGDNLGRKVRCQGDCICRAFGTHVGKFCKKQTLSSHEAAKSSPSSSCFGFHLNVVTHVDHSSWFGTEHLSWGECDSQHLGLSPFNDCPGAKGDHGGWTSGNDSSRCGRFGCTHLRLERLDHGPQFRHFLFEAGIFRLESGSSTRWSAFELSQNLFALQVGKANCLQIFGTGP
mmetsp:Transcript_11295/g.23121  ORF Transcript_11295/g.23121 Transcript_11295/m.23121 type:complete len:320 (-) Transcript_11295:161-1120(-)